ncbi:hypothetical protein D3C57_106190 [Streptomyces rapamycinicus NRRL 5491]|uniref:Uncharacterized protein n=2 Tax=Streptomyces rapamycinicus TaxID=1226757 RepID=A0A3L8RED8_STRRN|nr:hypothetical protein D3C57_106190 [Streptomyces rapamycinicus NRRL 5491]
MPAGWPGPQPGPAAEDAREAAPEPVLPEGAEVAEDVTVERARDGAEVAEDVAAERAPDGAEWAEDITPEPVPEAGPGAVPEPPGPADPAPLGVDRTPTGVAEVDARLARLADADHLGTSGHLEVYEDVHQGLRDTLTALDRRPGPPAPGPRPPSAT